MSYSSFSSPKLPEGEYVGNSCEEWWCFCPKCGEKKFYWNVEHNIGHCKRGSCSIVVRGLQEFNDAFSGKLKHYDTLSKSGSRSSSSNGLDTTGLWFTNAWENDKARRYLVGRGITEIESRTIPLYWIEERQALGVKMFPCSSEFTKNEILYRPLDMEKHKWMPLSGVQKEHYIWGAEFWNSDNKCVILCEGIMDIISSGLIGNALAMLGSEINKTVATWLLQQGVHVYLWPDADKAGDKARKEVGKMLTHCAVPYSVLNSKKDPKDYSREEVKRLLERLRNSAI